MFQVWWALEVVAVDCRACPQLRLLHPHQLHGISHELAEEARAGAARVDML